MVSVVGRGRGGAPLRRLDEVHDLDDAAIDVAVRIGWLLRTARRTAGSSQLAQSDMRDLLESHGHPLSTSAISEVESGQFRSSRISAAYETALGLQPGQLSSAIDVLCRTFPNSPVDRHPMASDPSPAELSRLTSRVMERHPTGSDWLSWGRAFSDPGARGLPIWVLEPCVTRLVSELGRAVGVAYTTRYEALTRLRCGPYATEVLDIAKAVVADPGVQVLFDLMSAMSELPDQDVLAWCCNLLDDPRLYVMRGAMLAFNNMAVGGRLPPKDWRLAEDPIVAVHDSSRDDPERFAVVSELLACLPKPMRGRLRHRITGQLDRPARLARYGAMDQSNARWSQSVRIAQEIAASHSISDPELLARLVFELIYDHRDTRAVTTTFLVLATPVAGGFVEALYERALALPPADRALALDRLMNMQSGHSFAPTREWPRPGDLEDLFTFVTLQAQASVPVSENSLNALLSAGGRHARRALYAAGLLKRTDWLRRQADDTSLHEFLRAGSHWWISHKGVIRL